MGNYCHLLRKEAINVTTKETTQQTPQKILKIVARDVVVGPRFWKKKDWVYSNKNVPISVIGCACLILDWFKKWKDFFLDLLPFSFSEKSKNLAAVPCRMGQESGPGPTTTKNGTDMNLWKWFTPFWPKEVCKDPSFVIVDRISVDFRTFLAATATAQRWTLPRLAIRKTDKARKENHRWLTNSN